MQDTISTDLGSQTSVPQGFKPLQEYTQRGGCVQLSKVSQNSFVNADLGVGEGTSLCSAHILLLHRAAPCSRDIPTPTPQLACSSPTTLGAVEHQLVPSASRSSSQCRLQRTVGWYLRGGRGQQDGSGAAGEAEIVGTAAPPPTWLAGACLGVMERGSGSEGSQSHSCQPALSTGSIPRAVTARTRTWRQVRNTRHLCASPGGRSLQWGCLCCHHVHAKMKGGLNWLLQGPVLCSKHPCPRGEAPQSRAHAEPSDLHVALFVIVVVTVVKLIGSFRPAVVLLRAPFLWIGFIRAIVAEQV